MTRVDVLFRVCFFFRFCNCVRAPSAGIVCVEMLFTVHFCAFATPSVLFSVRVCAFANAFVHPLRGSWVSRCILQCIFAHSQLRPCFLQYVFAHLQMRSCTLCGDRGCRHAFYSVFLLICKCVRAPSAGIVGVDMRFTVCFLRIRNFVRRTLCRDRTRAFFG